LSLKRLIIGFKQFEYYGSAFIQLYRAKLSWIILFVNLEIENSE